MKNTKSEDTKSEAPKAEAKAEAIEAPEAKAEVKAELTLDEEIALSEARTAILVEKKTAKIKASRESQKEVLAKVVNDAIGVAYDAGLLNDYSLLAKPYANFDEVRDDTGATTGVVAEIEERSQTAQSVRAAGAKKNGKVKPLSRVGSDARIAQDCFKASGGTMTVKQIKAATGLKNGGQITNVLKDVGWLPALESNPGVPRCDVNLSDDE